MKKTHLTGIPCKTGKRWKSYNLSSIHSITNVTCKKCIRHYYAKNKDKIKISKMEIIGAKIKPMNTQEILEAAITKYGVPNQEDKAIEEMAELTQAIIKYRQYPNPENLVNLYSEIADVGILLAQLRIIYGPGNIDQEKASKLVRLEGIINGTVKDKNV